MAVDGNREYRDEQLPRLSARRRCRVEGCGNVDGHAGRRRYSTETSRGTTSGDESVRPQQLRRPNPTAPMLAFTGKVFRRQHVRRTASGRWAASRSTGQRRKPGPRLDHIPWMGWVHPPGHFDFGNGGRYDRERHERRRPPSRTPAERVHLDAGDTLRLRS